MKFRKFLSGLTIFLVSFLLAVSVNAADLVAHHQGDDIVAHQQGGTLGNAPDYDWWYGCSATSAGMMMGYYDRNGYAGLEYNNLVPGGVAELSNYGGAGPLANSAIASTGHIADFWVAYGTPVGSDPNPGTTRAFDCLADFMGTNQDATGNSDGSTTFWNWNDGSRFTASDAETFIDRNTSGMYGMWEYFQYAGYNDLTAKGSFFNQYILGHVSSTSGFSWADYMAEIDAGRVVMIHVDGHSMFGYGYDDATDEVILHDTWTEAEHRMAWGGAYSGLDHYGVTCFTPYGGTDPTPPPIPEPSTMVLLGIGLFGSVAVIRRKRNS